MDPLAAAHVPAGGEDHGQVDPHAEQDEGARHQGRLSIIVNRGGGVKGNHLMIKYLLEV